MVRTSVLSAIYCMIRKADKESRQLDKQRKILKKKQKRINLLNKTKETNILRMFRNFWNQNKPKRKNSDRKNINTDPMWDVNNEDQTTVILNSIILHYPYISPQLLSITHPDSTPDTNLIEIENERSTLVTHLDSIPDTNVMETNDIRDKHNVRTTYNLRGRYINNT
jgi:hypothetical protein